MTLRIAAAAFIALGLLTTAGVAADLPVLRLSIQKTGTVAWEVDVIRRHGLDAKNGFALAVSELASVEAGKIALKGEAADMMVTDWLWVSRERALGSPMQFVPYSASVGALMVPAGSPIRGLPDLRGKSLSVAGGPLDKSWLVLQAAARQEGVDLKREAKLAFGAPPLLFEKMLQGEHEASLTYWNFAARLETKGYRRVLSVEEAARRLGTTGGVAMLGYVFDGDWATTHGELVAGFLAASREAKQILASSDAEWDRIRPLTQAPDDASFVAYRQRYREGIPGRPLAEEEADARTLFKVMAELGGAELVGPGAGLDPGTYYKPATTP